MLHNRRRHCGEKSSHCNVELTVLRNWRKLLQSNEDLTQPKKKKKDIDLYIVVYQAELDRPVSELQICFRSIWVRNQ